MLHQDDEAFVRAFEDGSLAKDAFTHRSHIRLAWAYLQREPFDAALGRTADGIRAFAARHGASGLFHATITEGWVRLVGHALASVSPDAPFDALLEANPHLLDKKALDRHFEPDTLASASARAAWVEPDREPLPLPSRAAVGSSAHVACRKQVWQY